jgi:hypothetical protein
MRFKKGAFLKPPVMRARDKEVEAVMERKILLGIMTMLS